MKRKTVLLFLCLIVLLSATAGIVACKVEHKHAFTEQNVDEAYLASPATCTSSATYYYSCACGEKGTATFASGNALNHSFTNYVSDGNATCTADGTKTAKCDRDGCNATDTVADEGSVIPHTFDKQVATEQYLASAATCTGPATYYYSCACGEKGTATFASGNALGHSYSTEWSYNQTEHWHAATCGHNVDSGRTAHSFDDNKKCTVCDYVTTKPLGLELQSTVFDINLATKTAYLKVANAVSEYDFSDKFSVADGARFDVCTDKQCNNKIASKKSDISAGNNVFYILVTNGNDVASYTITLRRRPVYTVTFNTNGGTAVETQRVEEDKCATAPTTTRKGYDFTAWDYDFSSPILRDRTITASWNILTYNIVYDLNVPADSVSQNVDNSANPTTYTVEDEITFVAPTRKGYTATWSITKIEKGTVGEIKVVAIWTAIDYQIIYDFGDTSSASKATNNELNPSTYTIEDEITFGEPTRAGYTFMGWDKNIAKGTMEAQTIAASWQIIVYNIYYELNGGENVEGNPAIYTIEDEVVLLLPLMTGYTGAWNNGGKIEKGSIGDIIFTASYTINQYTVNVVSSVSNSCTFTDISGTYDYNTSITVEISEVFLGYDFLGWYNGDILLSRGKSCTINVPANNITLTAKVSVKEEIQNFVFASTTSTCQITGVKDKTITNIVVPEIVTSIAEGALGGCNNLVNITLPFVGASSKTANDTYQYPFGYIFGTSSYTGGVATTQCYYGSSTSSTTDNTYYIPSSLKSVTITGENILYGAFYNCSGLTSVTIPDSVTSIGSDAFYGCDKLENIYITDIAAWCKISGIGNLMRYGSSNKKLYLNNELLTDLVIPDSVTSIGSYAFRGCSGLTSVTIPSSVTSIGNSAFSGCSGLKYNEYDNALYLGNKSNPYVALIKAKTTDITSCYINEKCKVIYSSAFSGCSGLTSITLPFVGGSRKTSSDTYQYPFGYIFGTSSYTGGVATEQCYYGSSTSSTTYATYYIPSSLKSVTITGGNILYGAFYGCSGLTSVTIPDSVTSIGSSAFYGCSKLENIYITDIAAWCKISGIGNLMYYGSSNKKLYLNNELLTNLVIPDSVTSIGGGAFV